MAVGGAPAPWVRRSSPPAPRLRPASRSRSTPPAPTSSPATSASTRRGGTSREGHRHRQELLEEGAVFAHFINPDESLVNVACPLLHDAADLRRRLVELCEDLVLARVVAQPSEALRAMAEESTS